MPTRPVKDRCLVVVGRQDNSRQGQRQSSPRQSSLQAGASREPRSVRLSHATTGTRPSGRLGTEQDVLLGAWENRSAAARGADSPSC